MSEASVNRGYRRLMGVSAIALAVLLVLVGVGVLLSLRRSADVRTSDESKTHTGITAIRAEVDSGNLSVRVASDTTTTVVRHLRWSAGTNGPPKVTEQVEGGTLVVREVGCGNIVLFYRCDADIAITVPAGIGLELKSDSGTVIVDGTTGGVRLTADSGTVVLSNLSGDLTVRSDSGRVKATGLASRSSDVQTDSGEVRLEFVAAPTNVRLVTDSGRATILVPRDTGPYAVAATTDSGARRIGVSTSDSATNRVTVKTDSGGVTVDYLR